MRLYPETETQFDTNGIGVLADAVSCIVTEERNGAFELELQYPVDGIHFAQLRNRCIILAAPNPVDDEQPFRIYKISKPMGGIVTVNAEHISYDLSGIVLMPFEAVGVADALAQFVTKAVTSNPFKFDTDKSSGGNFSVRVPQSIRACMGGREGSLLDVYGGEYRYDRFRVSLLNARGQNNGVSIRYGKNLTDLTQEENIAGVYTAAYPFWTSEEYYLELPERLVAAPGTYAYTRILTLDLSQEFQEKPTVEQLRTRAQSYVEQNKIGVPSVSIQVSFVPLEQTEEYKNIALLERVMLCDTVNVQFDALGVDATAKCVKTVYNVLKQRYDSVLLGDAKATIADTILEQKKEISKAPTVTAMQAAILSATKLITGNSGGHVVMHASTGGKQPDEILIMDTPDIATAKKVWRWNQNGLGHSKKGYNGPYGLAATADGAIVADFITVGTLNANLIKAGVLQSLNGKTFFLDLENGVLRMQANEISIAGKSVEQIAQEKADAAESSAKAAAEVSANDAVNAQTQKFVFDKLTNNSATQGVFLKDGEIYINAQYIETGMLSSKNGKSSINLDTGVAKLSGSITTTNDDLRYGASLDGGKLCLLVDGNSIGKFDVYRFSDGSRESMLEVDRLYLKRNGGDGSGMLFAVCRRNAAGDRDEINMEVSQISLPIGAGTSRSTLYTRTDWKRALDVDMINGMNAVWRYSNVLGGYYLAAT